MTQEEITKDGRAFVEVVKKIPKEKRMLIMAFLSGIEAQSALAGNDRANAFAAGVEAGVMAAESKAVKGEKKWGRKKK